MVEDPLHRPRVRRGVEAIGRQTATGGADGSTYTQALAPNQCLSGMPGVPGTTQSARLIEMRPMNMDPATRCTATGPHMPPPPLRTRVRMQCR